MCPGPHTYTYLAAIDLDKTLLSVNSSTLIVKEARKRGFMSSSDFFQAICFSVIYKFDLKDAHEIVHSMMKWIKGIHEQEFVDLLQKHAIDRIIGSIRPVMKTIIADHRKQGAKVILLSSAMPYICHPVATAASLDDVVCSSLEVKNGYFTGETNGPLVFGPEKAVRMKSYCLEHGFDLSSAWYYGDAFTDRFVLQSVGNPVCISPEIRLGNLARKHGWQIIRDKR